MRQKLTELNSEVVLATKQNSMRLLRGVRKGLWLKIAPRLYTNQLHDSPEKIVQRNLHAIIALLFPGAIISHRSSFETKPTKDGQYFITYRFTKTHRLPGVTLRLIKGSMNTVGTSAFMGTLYISKRERAFLENLQPSRVGKAGSKILAQSEIEKKLDELCLIHGETYLNQLRDEARSIAKRLKMQREFAKLNKIIAAILASHPGQILQSAVARARARGVSYDPARIERFRVLYDYLNDQELRSYANAYEDPMAYDNEGFFEAYFSNYIEGTRFEVAEAQEIVYSGKIPPNRPEGHDILGTYRLIINRREMQILPTNPEHCIQLLKHRHRMIMSAHVDLRPGEFKERRNQAGSTYFVEPSAVQGTLMRGFEFYELLRVPLKQAIFMMFLIAEVHPFDDGNGRMARIMMNSILYAHRQQKIIVPNVFRDDYMGCLKRLTKQNDPVPLVKAMNICLQFTARIDFRDYQMTLKELERRHAFSEPTEAKLIV